MGLKKRSRFNIGSIGMVLGGGVGLWAVLGAFVPGVPNMAEVFGGAMSDVEGNFESTEAAPLGVWSFAPDACRSGERMGFYGVWLLRAGDEEGHGVRLAKEADGSIVVATSMPGTDQMAVFSGCEVSGDLRRTTTQVNEVWGMEGNIAIDCPDDGFRGSATFSGCY